jgi:hypothetical protein
MTSWRDDGKSEIFLILIPTGEEMGINFRRTKKSKKGAESMPSK